MWERQQNCWENVHSILDWDCNKKAYLYGAAIQKPDGKWTYIIVEAKVYKFMEKLKEVEGKKGADTND